ncbi:MAG: mechanosensitive ion channel family protein [Lachnospiraceae bacterium]|jgi:small conductance mechanosensitive channel|nr:mechanosensitive ion channel family protein [Lachnospiraceae bacterium]MCI8985076.1 mechanosensitive ion channel family protein [Lachnospiraceae bacterium]MCI9014412.1 mechanosensitive ion channel family protein [Lachnospiraceae bacterium]MCI9254046.1 mechanosensitive ion channel family protein [Lachnospiraceae bacterium]
MGMEKQAAGLEQIAQEEIDVGLIQTYVQQLPDKALRFGIRVLLALVVFFIGVQVIKLVRGIVRRSLKRGNADIGVSQFLDSFIKTVLYILLLFMIASGFGLDATSVVALLGSAGVAIGLAIQGSLSNFAGGVLILLLKPFRVDDYIKVDNDGHEGTVKEIQLFYTKLSTPNNHVVIIPNGTLSNSSILNMSTLTERRMDILVGISYDADIRQAREVIMKVLEEDESVLATKDRRVFVDTLADSGVNLNVRCWADNETYWECKWRITEKIKYALDEAGISIPYPQLDVHIAPPGECAGK